MRSFKMQAKSLKKLQLLHDLKTALRELFVTYNVFNLFFFFQHRIFPTAVSPNPWILCINDYQLIKKFPPKPNNS